MNEGFLLDTNVISEWTKARPEPAVAAWLEERDEDVLFLSVVSFAEIRRGIERLPESKHRQRLTAWLVEDLTDRFDRRILPIDRAVSEAWGQVTVRCERAGRTISVLDGFLAASAEVYGLVLATRDVRDFTCTGIKLVDPWDRTA